MDPFSRPIVIILTHPAGEVVEDLVPMEDLVPVEEKTTGTMMVPMAMVEMEMEPTDTTMLMVQTVTDPLVHLPSAVSLLLTTPVLPMSVP